MPGRSQERCDEPASSLVQALEARPAAKLLEHDLVGELEVFEKGFVQLPSEHFVLR